MHNIIREKSMEKIAKQFKLSAKEIKFTDRFGIELKAGLSIFSENVMDDIVFDLYFVADKNIECELNNGELIIETVEDYCNHMERCFKTEPKSVREVLDIS